jgi:peptide/nickel transport system permease protein
MTVSAAVDAAAEAAEPSQSASRFRDRWYRTPSFVSGCSIIGVIVLLAVLAPVITSQGPASQDLLNTFSGPSWQHPFGTDGLGRDVWSRIVYGARTDLPIALLAVLFSFAIGTAIGLLSGYFGRGLDTTTTWLANIVTAFPFYVLVLALVFALGSGERNIYVAIAAVGWVSYTRLVRGEVLVAKRSEYVLAARVGGIRTHRIILRHLLPNVITQPLVYAMSDVVFALLAIAALGYLGLGVQPPTADWGKMIADGQISITTHWELSTIPGCAVVITALGLSLLADGLADILRPP